MSYRKHFSINPSIDRMKAGRDVTACLLSSLPPLTTGSWQMAAPPLTWFCQSILPVVREFFLPAVAKTLGQGGRLIVGAFSVYLYYCRVFTSRYEAPKAAVVEI